MDLAKQKKEVGVSNWIMNFPVSEVVSVTITLDNRKSAVVIIFLFMKDRKVDIKNIFSFIEILAEYPITKKNLYSLYLKDEHLNGRGINKIFYISKKSAWWKYNLIALLS